MRHGIHALREIGKIVAGERQADEDDAKVLRWPVRHGWLVVPGIALAAAYWMGVI